MDPHETVRQHLSANHAGDWLTWMEHPNQPMLDAGLDSKTGWWAARGVTQIVGDGQGEALAADRAVTAALRANDAPAAMAQLQRSPATVLVTVIEMARRRVGFPLMTDDRRDYLESADAFLNGLDCCPMLTKQVWEPNTEWSSDDPDVSIPNFILSRHDYHPTLAEKIRTRMAEAYKSGAGFSACDFYAQTVVAADQPWIEISFSISTKDLEGRYSNGQDDWYRTTASFSYAKLSIDPDWLLHTQVIATLLEKRRAMMDDWFDGH